MPARKTANSQDAATVSLALHDAIRQPAGTGFLWICWFNGYWPLAQAGGRLQQRLLRLAELSAPERPILR
jgi:hypothetical protein